MPPRKTKGAGVSSLIRKAGQVARRDAITTSSTIQDGGQKGPRIFSIIDYIEQPWGLSMRLYPGQRFLVKLYYHLELDDTEQNVPVTDMFNTKVLYRFTEKEFLKYLFEEGRCNIGEQDHERRELILPIGRRAGKCVSGDTLVLTDLGLFPIKDLACASEEDTTSFNVGVAQEGGRQARSAFFYDGGVKPTFSVKSWSGYSVRGTGNHRVRVMAESGCVEWKYLDNIRPGDYLAVNRTTDLWSQDLVDLKPFHNTDGYKDLSFPDTFSEKWGLLLGYLVGDGSWAHTQGVAMTVEHPETWDRLKELFNSLLGSHRVQMDQRTEGTGRLEFPSVGMRRFLANLGWVTDCGRYDKMVPWVVLRSPRHVVCAFLRGLFETDGSAECGGRHITFSSASFRLAHEVQVLLLNLGIVSNIGRKWNRKTKRHYANLSIKGVRSRRRFAQLVGFDSEKKQGPLLEALERAQEGKSNTESVPHQYTRVRNLLKSVPKRNSARGELGWGRSHLRKALGNVCKPGSKEDLTYTRMVEALKVARELGAGKDEMQHFEDLLHQDYFFDPVVSVEEGEDHVYDLNVPDGASFVANGLTNHNTTLSAIFASYEVYRLLNLYNPQEYYGLPNGNRVQIISVATDKDQAGLLYNDVASHLAKCQYFTPYIANNTQTHVHFRTPYEIDRFGSINRVKDGSFQSFQGKSSLRVTFKSCIARGLRGAGNVIIILDEVAHFQDNGTSSAKEIYEAITPSTASFSPKDPEDNQVAIGPVEARTILISSPLGKSGLFWEKFDQAMRGGEGSENLLAVQAPTWEINPTVESSYYKQKYHADPTVFMVEHGAMFSDQMRGWIERESDLLDCIDPDLRPHTRGLPRSPHQMGIDIGLVGDGTGIVITHPEGEDVVLDYHETWQAGVDWRESNPHLVEPLSNYAKTLSNVERLDFDEIADWIALLCKHFYITDGLFDRWNGIPLEQRLHKMGLKQFNSQYFTRDQSSKIFQQAKLLMYDKRLRLYDYPLVGKKHSQLIQELLSLQARQVSKNLVVVEAPKVVDAHDDLSDAFVRAVHLSEARRGDKKFIAQGGRFAGAPYAASAMSVTRYQRSRSRRHGQFSERSVGRR